MRDACEKFHKKREPIKKNRVLNRNKEDHMSNRMRTLGITLLVVGVVFAVAGGVAYTKVQDGYDSLQSFSEAQGVELSYNDAGELVDRGTTEGALAILSLLEDDWGYPVVMSDLDPADPLRPARRPLRLRATRLPPVPAPQRGVGRQRAPTSGWAVRGHG